VERLVRVRFGPVTLGNLEPGECRPLTSKELDIISALAREPKREKHGTA
jgi:23S rRNA pseudouridine2605 synthase